MMVAPHTGAAATPLRPRRRFGQHFLHDPAVLARIVEHVGPRRDDALVEIGPGRGALTRLLLERVARLDAIELDRDLAAYLARDCGDHSGLHLHQADALDFDYRALAAARGARLRIVGNLPYNVSTRLLMILLAQRDAISDMCFMVQQEVAARLCAEAGQRDYGRLGVMFGLHCETRRLFGVGPGAFTPPPKVDSTMIAVRPRAAPLAVVHNPASFEALVRTAFGTRRKTLRRALRDCATAEDFAAAAVNPAARAGEIPITGFAALANVIATRAAAPDRNQQQQVSQ